MNFAKVGKIIKERRRELSLTQKQLAERVGICRAHLISVEKGRTIPLYDKMVKIQQILKLPQSV